MMDVPRTDFEAAVLALRLAITAPDEEKCWQCVEIVESLNLCAIEIERAKIEALHQVERIEHHETH
jgi:hypothetical protein|tara:strand:- start:2423 stop:2620 length:198 start_codon:yes stop_codon:yes gene_type:complete